MTERRETVLRQEHLSLGADMDSYAWSGMALPWSYRTSLAEEQRAVREAAGLADVSQLRVVQVVGPDAVDCVEALVPRAIHDMAPGTTRFSVLLSPAGRIVDETLIMRLGLDDFWLSHGCGSAQTQLATLAQGRNMRVETCQDMHVLSLQGPRAHRVLEAVVECSLPDVPAMGHRRTQLAGRAVVLSRTGFTGEDGFEIFCRKEDAITLWRELLGPTKSSPVTAYGYACIDLLRIEAGFTLFPSDLAFARSIWEAGLGWLVRDKHADFVGREAAFAAARKGEHVIVGARSPGEHPLTLRKQVSLHGEPVGIVTSSAYSPMDNEVLSILRVRRRALEGVEACVLESVTGIPLRVSPLPFRPRRGMPVS